MKTNECLYSLKITDPSGETRSLEFSGEHPLTLGKLKDADILIKDMTLPDLLGHIVFRENPRSHTPSPWIILSEGSPSALLAAIPVRESMLPYGVTLKVGETRLSLENPGKPSVIPLFPRNSRHWKTVSTQGTDLLRMAKKAAMTPLSIYIAGDTGTGKEVIAGLLHAWSDRASGPFIPLHCGALAPSLAESELFGHVKGAFTGASHQRVGALLQAHGGTLFLDEVGDLSLDLQVKLLRFLENGEIRPVGSDQTRHANVRVVCATHLPLRKLVDEGKFRRDLYYRLASVTLEIPPLFSRPEDIALLASDFAADLGKIVAPRTLLRLQAYSWPGNVRELRHAIERGAGLSGPFQTVLDDTAFEFLFETSSKESGDGYIGSELTDGLITLIEMEKVMILRSLRLTRGNRAEAAKILGVARSTLFEMLKRHKIEGPRAHLRKKAA